MREFNDNDDILLIDAHCHLSLNPEELQHDSNLKPVFEKYSCDEQNLILNVMTTTHKDHEVLECNKIFLNNDYPNLRLGVGIHPWYCHIYTLDSHTTKLQHYIEILATDSEGNDSDDLNELVANNIDKLPNVIDINSFYVDSLFSKYSFVGEVGLDLSATILELEIILNVKNIKVKASHQKAILQFFIDKAIQHGFVMSLHAVNAGLATYTLLKECDTFLAQSEKTAALKIVFHSYTGTIEQFQQQYLKLKNIHTYISLSGYINLRQPLTKKMEKLLQGVDITRILLETDVPINTQRSFVFRDELFKTLKFIADKKGIDYRKLNKQLCENYKNIYL